MHRRAPPSTGDAARTGHQSYLIGVSAPRPRTPAVPRHTTNPLIKREHGWTGGRRLNGIPVPRGVTPWISPILSQQGRPAPVGRSSAGRPMLVRARDAPLRRLCPSRIPAKVLSACAPPPPPTSRTVRGGRVRPAIRRGFRWALGNARGRSVGVGGRRWAWRRVLRPGEESRIPHHLTILCDASIAYDGIALTGGTPEGIPQSSAMRRKRRVRWRNR